MRDPKLEAPTAPQSANRSCENDDYAFASLILFGSEWKYVKLENQYLQMGQGSRCLRFEFGDADSWILQWESLDSSSSRSSYLFI